MKRKRTAGSRKNACKDRTPLAARESEENFLKVFHANPLPMSITSLPDGKYLDVNKEFERVSGWSAGEAIGKTTAELNMWVHPGDFRLLSERLTKENSARGVELALRTRAGEVLTMLWSAEVAVLGGSRCIITSAYDITDRKRIENALHGSEEKFRSMIEQNLEGFSLIDEAGTIIEWNTALEDMTGIKRNDAVGRPMWDVQAQMRWDEAKSPGFNERIREMMRSMIKSGTNPLLGKPFETPIRKPDGSSAVIQQIVFPIKTESGFRFGSIKRDITEQKKAMQALAESEDKFRTTIEQSLEGLSLIDEKGIVLEWNAALASITGIARTTAFGMPLWKVHEMMRLPKDRTPQQLEKSRANILRSMQHSESPYVGRLQESIIYRPDGTPVDIQQIVYPIKTAIGIRLGSVIRDITLQKASQKALKQSEELYRALIETTGTGYVVIDDSGRVLDANLEYVRLTGHGNLNEIRGRTVFEWTAPNHKEKNRKAVKQCTQDGSIRNFEVDYIDENSRITPILINATVAKMDGTQRILTLCRDMTEKKRMEENLNKSEKLESLGILAGGIAHDFNNLLTGIFGFIDVARLYNTSGAADKVSVNLTKALDVFNRARALTQQLLTFSKGGLPVKKVLSLPPLLTNTTNFVLSGSTVRARFSFPEDLWPCEVDENQIGQVIDNIVINARQAMPTGGALVITAENMPQASQVPAPLVPGDYVKISIRDSGTGISKEHLPRIFDPFFTTKQEGSGLGLATAYSIVRKHDGIIDVESELGAGAVFHLYLPASPLARIEAQGTGGKKHRGTGTVLVLDDEDFVRDVAVELLNTMGYSVDTAASGAEAIEKYRAARASPSPYRFCILDLTIPNGMGGKDAVQALLSLDPSVAAIAASGYSQDPVMTDPKTYGFRDKIRKPFTKEELGEVLERVTGGK